MHVLAFSMSPRRGGNSETLLGAFSEGLTSAGITIDTVRTHELDILPCTGCAVCEKTGRCVINDAFDALIDRIISCDVIVFATPLYFMNVPARGKALLDRFQVFWASRHRLDKDLFDGRERKGVLLACAGARSGPRGANVFRGLEDTMNYVFDALGLSCVTTLLVPGVDALGDMKLRTETLEKAEIMGRSLLGYDK